MLFNSYEFVFVFLPLTWAVYFELGKQTSPKWATGWLILCSLVFYGYYDVRYVPLLLTSIIFNYIVGRTIEISSKKRLVLGVGIVSNLLLLGYYKYTGFLFELANVACGAMLEIPKIVLPLGISFFTFTQIAYLVDAYRGETKQYGALDYLLFVTIFPHLIAGPIINHRDMLPQFSNKSLMRVDYDNLARGLVLFSIGLFKKVVVADKLAIFADKVFVDTTGVGFVSAWIGAVGYSLQLYFDFSAYSEMAIGLGLLFNMRLPQNFNSPYQASSIIDFWHRWHMTLGEWVKNYLYIPMGGNRVRFKRKMANLFVAMALVGLWHGAGWTFVIWGALHGGYLIVNNAWVALGYRLNYVLARVVTFLAVVIAWVVFRADTVGSAFNLLAGMFGFNGFEADCFAGNGRAISWLLGGLIAVLILPNPVNLVREQFNCNIVWLASIAFMFVYAILKMNEISYFLYFQF